MEKDKNSWNKSHVIKSDANLCPHLHRWLYGDNTIVIFQIQKGMEQSPRQVERRFIIVARSGLFFIQLPRAEKEWKRGLLFGSLCGLASHFTAPYWQPQSYTYQQQIGLGATFGHQHTCGYASVGKFAPRCALSASI